MDGTDGLLFVPAAHLIKYIFDLSHSHYPDTINSILELAIISFVVTVGGFGIGVMLRRFINFNPHQPKL